MVLKTPNCDGPRMFDMKTSARNTARFPTRLARNINPLLLARSALQTDKMNLFI